MQILSIVGDTMVAEVDGVRREGSLMLFPDQVCVGDYVIVHAGFEPADVMQGVEMLVRQVLEKRAEVEIQYGRVVTWEGNRKAQELMAEVFLPCDAEWRGLGVIPRSGLDFSTDFTVFDAASAMCVEVEPLREHPGCRCGDILRGRISPQECPLFNDRCTPESPVGACMVSSEGTCAAAARYGEQNDREIGKKNA